MKIFELANEIEGEITPLQLVEKLKGYGFAVRNHMSTLSEEEVIKFHIHLDQEKKALEEAEGTKKKTKKKVTKKKAAKKKIAKKVAKKVAKKADKTSVDDSEKVTAKKTKTVKKKTVIRRKSGENETLKAEEAANQLEEKSVTKEASLDTEAQTQVASFSEKKNAPIGGLRVVKDAGKPHEELKADATEEEKALYKEKIHKFTPVFIPEGKEEIKEEKKETKLTTDPIESDDKKDNADNTTTAKKRMGGLASLMSGKKGATRSQVLNETRSTSELKSYAALSTLGRPIYTQLKRKRIYSGPSDKTEITEIKEAKRIIQLHGGGTVKQIAKKLSIKVKDLIDMMLEINLLCRADDFIGIKLASHVTNLYDYRVEDIKFNED